MFKKSALLLLMVLLASVQMVVAESVVLKSDNAIHFAMDRKGKSKAPKVKKQKRLAGKGKSKAPKVQKAKRQTTKGKSKAPKIKKASKGKNYSKRDNYP